MDNTREEVKAQVQKIAKIVDPHEHWVVDAPYLQHLEELFKELDVLESLQSPFHIVDAELPWNDRANRLLAWVRTHRSFKSAKIALVENIPSSSSSSSDSSSSSVPSTTGHRGVQTFEKITAGDLIMSVPFDTAISTETALNSKEIGPLIENGLLRDTLRIPTLLIGLHVLTEHTKCLLTPLSSTQTEDTVKIPVPANVLSGRTEEEMRIHRASLLKNVRSKDIPSPVARTTRLDIPSTTTSPGTNTNPTSDYHPWGSRYRAFLACMPPSVTVIGNCLSWKYEDFVYLHGLPAAHVALRLLRDLVKSYCVLYTHIVDGNAIDGLQQYFTWAHFRWALALIMSRQNMYNGSNGTRHFALIPLYDMVNHAPGPITSFHSPSTNSLDLDAMQDFSKGTEVFMSYGDRPNTELLVYQGFLADNNNDACSIPLPSVLSGTTNDPIGPLRLRLLANMQIVPQVYAQKHLMSAAIRATIEANKHSSKPVPVSLDLLSETDQWNLPFSFEISRSDLHDSNGLPDDLLAYCRVANLTKTDAVIALRTLQTATEQVKLQLAAIKKAKAEAKAARRIAKLKQELSGGHGHSHNGQPCGGHGHGGGHGHSRSGGHGHSHGPDEECDSDEEDDFSDEDGDTAHGHSHGGQPCGGHGHSHGGHEEELPPIYLPFVSETNETAARGMARQALENFLNNFASKDNGSGSSNTSNDGYRSFLRKYRNDVLQDVQTSLASLATK